MTTPLQFRQQTIQRLLTLYDAIQSANEETTPVLAQEITALESKLGTLDKALINVHQSMFSSAGSQSTANSQQADTLAEYTVKETLRTQSLAKKEVNQLLIQLLTNEQESENFDWLKLLQKTMAALHHFKDQQAGMNSLLNKHSPFALADCSESAILQAAAKDYENLQSFIEDQEAIALNYIETGSFDGLITPLPLYEYDDMLTRWVQLERASIPLWDVKLTDQAYQAFLNSHFCQQAAKKAWQQLKRLARFEQDRDQARLTATQGAHFEADQILYTGRHNPENTQSTNTTVAPLTTVLPQFVDEDGNPYANTQVLCWRYQKSNSQKLGRMDIDKLMPNLTTIGLLYTDYNGKPTLVKPSFLTKAEHSIHLQVNPATGGVLLLEHSKASKPEGFVEDDPLTANWFSYGLSEHLQNMNQAINHLPGTTAIENKQAFETLALNEIGLKQSGCLFEDITASDITGFYELAADYHYGFMVLPLGFGSMAIDNIAELPSQTNQGEAVAKRYLINTATEEIPLPKTIRQYAYECYQARNGMYNGQKAMMAANAHKHADIARVEKLKHWVNFNADFPSQGKDPINTAELEELNTALCDLQEGIRATQLRTAPMAALNVRSDAAKFSTYTMQKKSADAFNGYCHWVNKGFALLENETLLQRVKQWADAQEDIDEQVQKENTKTLISEAERLADPNESNVRLFSLYWSSPITQTNGLQAPYTPLVYDSLMAVIALLSQSHRDDELFGKHLLPTIDHCINESHIAASIKALQEQETEFTIFREFGFDALNKPINSELKNQSPPLAKIFGSGFNIAKTTFIRGPGAPALLEGILELGSMMLQVGYATHTKVQVQVLIRIQMLQMMSIGRINIVSQSDRLVKLTGYIIRQTNPLNPQRLFNTRSLTDRVYGGDSWGNSNALRRIEASIKPVLFIYGKYKQLSDFMNNMDEESWENPTDEDFRSAAYRLLETLETTGNEAATLLAAPGMIDFWRNTLKLDKGKLALLLEKEISLGAQRGAQLVIQGNNGTAKLSAWLISGSQGATTVGQVMSTWTNRLSFAASAVACVQSVMDTGRNLSLGREYDALRSNVEAVGHGLIVAGAIVGNSYLMGLVGLNAIPAVGQALFIAGTVISIGLIAWDIYWQRAGRALFYSDTFVVFDDAWRAMRDQPHFNTYIDEEYGANTKLMNACKTIEDGYQNTILDAFKAEAIQESMQLQIAIDQNVRAALWNGTLGRLFGLEQKQQELPTISRDVEWQNLNWLSAARFFAQNTYFKNEQGQLMLEELDKVTDVAEADIELGCQFYDSQYIAKNDSSYSSDARDKCESDARFNLISWVRAIKDIAADYNKANESKLDSDASTAFTANIIWPNLVQGTFPDAYTKEDLLKAKYPFVSMDKRDHVVYQFLNRWEALTNAKS